MLSTKRQNAYKSRYMKKQNNITKNGIISVFHLLGTNMLKSMEILYKGKTTLPETCLLSVFQFIT